jgi:8-oxo-dGTP pyrophosphatase MutT (NUDIX family)
VGAPLTSQNPAELRRFIEARLKNTRAAVSSAEARLSGLAPEVHAEVQHHLPKTLFAAAVLVPIVERETGLTMLLTERSATLKNHAGQISFPGGRIEPDDTDAVAAALRECEEEIGLERQFVSIAGFLPPQVLLSGFWVSPVVGFVRPGFTLRPDETEVADVFEVPLEHVLDATNHRATQRTLGATTINVYHIPYLHRNIWGATAGMIVALENLLSETK